MTLSEQLFKGLFPTKEYKIESNDKFDKVYCPGFEVYHNKEGVLLAHSPGDMYGKRRLLHLRGKEIQFMANLLNNDKGNIHTESNFEIRSV